MKIIAVIVAAVMAACGFAQDITYRVGAIIGKGDLYHVAAADVALIYQDAKVKVALEGVAYTPLEFGELYGGFEVGTRITKIFKSNVDFIFGFGAVKKAESSMQLFKNWKPSGSAGLGWRFQL